MNTEIFVQNVKMLCLKQGIRPTNACKESGVGGSYLSDINRGRIPSVASVQKLAQYLGVTTSELLGEALPDKKMGEGLSGDEQQLIKDYRRLNQQGQEYIRQTMHMTVQTYKKSSDLSELEGQG